MAEYFKEPQNPLKKIDETTGDVTYVYPLTTDKQVIMENGERLNTVLKENILYMGETAEESVAEVINADTFGGQPPSYYASADSVVKKSEFLNMVYPIGAIYLSINSTSPSDLFGGTWTRIAQGRTLFGADGSDYIAGQTVEAGLPNIVGTASNDAGAGLLSNNGNEPNLSGAFYKHTANSYSYRSQTENVGGCDLGFDASRSNSIYGNSETVQPPALVVYMWQRIA